MLGNGLIEKMTPNVRLQPLKIELGSAAVSDEVGSFTFGYSGSTCVAGQTWANNGNVVSQAIKVGTSTFTQSYGYDGLNRLTCAKEGTAWEQRYGLDVYGNRWLTVNTLPMTSALTATAKSNFNAANNRLITAPTGGNQGYDAAGNLLRLSGGTGTPSVSHDLTYDGENRVVQSNNQGAITNYVYDGFGRRVQAGGRVFVYFPDGKLAMEAGGAVDDAPTKYLTADHLGSTRIVTRADQTVANRIDYAPYGEALAAGLGGRTEALKYAVLAQPFQISTKEPRQRFTGHYRDFETGLDYFGARYYTAVGGRFTSPDAPFADQFAEDPQSWNLYGYVRNNPLRYMDEDGRGAKEFFYGMMNAVNSNNSLGAIKRDQASHPHERLGQKVGDAISVIGGGIEMSVGLAAAGAGGGACAGTGVGCVPGVPVAAAGVAAAAHGGAVVATAMTNVLMSQGSDDGGSSQSSKESESQPKINEQKQAGHVPGTPQNENRKAQGKPTSSFFGEKSGEKLTQKAWKEGTPVPGKANTKVYSPGISTGTGPRGGAQKQVKVHQDKKGEIHGHPSGREHN